MSEWVRKKAELRAGWIMVIAVRLSCTMKGVRTTRKFIVRSKKAKNLFRFSEEKKETLSCRKFYCGEMKVLERQKQNFFLPENLSWQFLV